MDRKKLTIYVIGYNEESKLRDCLESVKWADELIFVDSYSTDKTSLIAKEYTDKIYQVKFEGFGKLRNKALEYVTNDWVLSVDADERVTDELKDEVLGKLKDGPGADAYYVPRKSHFLGYWVRHCGWYPDYRQPQFFNKKKMKYKEQLVHETFDLDGKLSYLKGHVLQYPFLNLNQFLRKMERYSDLRAEEMFADKKKFSVVNVVVNPLSMFFRMYIQKLGFLDGRVGVILSMLYAYYTLLKYVKLWEKYLNK